MSASSSIQWDNEEHELVEVCLREFSKSLTDWASTWCTRLPPDSIRTRDEMVNGFCSKFLDCYDDNEEHELVEACINNMLWEYRLHLENLNIVQFVDLLQMARRTALTVSERR
ncbi:hypothetical protein ACJW30_09G008200 [Castanea mollissima]